MLQLLRDSLALVPECLRTIGTFLHDMDYKSTIDYQTCTLIAVSIFLAALLVIA
jgi:hypothetical protein